MNRPDPIPFDTHRFVKRLTKEGMPTGQAEVLADEQVALLDSNLATRQDVAFLPCHQGRPGCHQRESGAVRHQGRPGPPTRKWRTKANEKLAQCATKEDLAATNEKLARCATKEDLAATNEKLAQCATKEDLAATNEKVAQCATKEDLAATNEKLAQCATKEDFSILDRRISRVAQDVAVLKSDLRTLKWVVSGVGFGMLTLVLGVSSLVIKLFWTV